MTTMLFRRLTLSSLATAAAFLPCALPASAQGEASTELQSYFHNVLAGNEATLPADRVLSQSECADAAKEVWQAWVDANNNFEEEKLPALQSLYSVTAGSWQLPADLEANAVMPFYYGAKDITQKPADGFPLFLSLHGSGAKAAEWGNGLLLAQKNDDAPSAYFIPQIPNEENYRWYQRSKLWAWKKLLRQAFVSGDINPAAIYFIGISEGAYGSQRLASFLGDYLAGAGPMAGGEPLKNAPAENCCNLAFNMKTGANDGGFYRNTLTEYTRQALDKLETDNPGYFVHDVQLLDGYAHVIPYNKTTPWLLGYKRNAAPKKVMWENFNMDGERRNGYYNILLEKDPLSPASLNRSFYTLNIDDDNNVALTSQRVYYSTIETLEGIATRFVKSYQKMQQGVVRLFFDERLVDMTKPVKITVNGTLYFDGLLTCRLSDMAESLAAFGDPLRIFPASVTLNLAEVPSGINEISDDVRQTSHEDNILYDLQGRRVTVPQHGIYINKAGKRFVK